MRKDLHHVLTYFGYFDYAPSFEEIHTFFPKEITRKTLNTLLISECKQKKLVQLPNKARFSQLHGSTNHYSQVTGHSRYTLPQYSIPTPGRHSREGGNPGRLDPSPLSRKASLRWDDNTRRIQLYIWLLKWLPLVRFVGITGKSAVEGLRMNDDIDLFIITQQGFIWTTRFIVVLLAKIFGIHGGNGVCLNLFFDESDLTINKIKQNSYIAHEILQMKPIIDKQNIYHTLIDANRWIFKYFPNASFVIPALCQSVALYEGWNAGIQRKISLLKIFDWIPVFTGMTQSIDYFFKSIQLPIIKKNKTGFRITNRQLWLFKRDFEVKLKKNSFVR